MNHMVRIFLAVIICLLGANPKANAQNPFLTQVDYIWQFDVSPDGKYLAYKQWNKDKVSKIVVKNLSSQKEFVVDSTEMSGNAPKKPIGLFCPAPDCIIFARRVVMKCIGKL